MEEWWDPDFICGSNFATIQGIFDLGILIGHRSGTAEKTRNRCRYTEGRLLDRVVMAERAIEFA